MTFINQTNFKHGQVANTKVGVLLINLGTPDAPTAPAVRRYLAEFLSDSRVIEIPSLVWKPILHGIILRTRPKASAKRYASIWTPEGSPLLVWTKVQAQAIQDQLQAQGHHLNVFYAMRYGNPSISSVMQTMQAQGIQRILAVPLYPQYAGSSTATAIDAVNQYVSKVRHQPELRFIKHFHDDQRYIQAMANHIRSYWASHGQAQKLVLSFHGVPKRTLLLGDPYHCECIKTGRLLKEALNLRDDQMVLTFQSRFGRAEWLQPYTEPTLIELAKQGVESLDIFCPGFVSECLETLEEIAVEAKQAYLQAGGRRYSYIPALNDNKDWLDGLSSLINDHLQGWNTSIQANESAILAKQALDAKALGAEQ